MQSKLNLILFPISTLTGQLKCPPEKVKLETQPYCLGYSDDKTDPVY